MLTPNGRRVSASTLDRAMRCLWPWVAKEPWQDVPRVAKEAGAFGNAVHAHHQDYLTCEPWDQRDIGELVEEFGVNRRRTSDLYQITEDWERWVMQRAEYLRPTYVETKLAWEPTANTVELKQDGDHRQYDLFADAALVGTADVVSMGIVTDWKTGSYTRPADSWQIRYLAAAYELHTGGVVTGRVVVERVGKEPQVLEHVFDRPTLAHYRERLRLDVVEPLRSPASIRPRPSVEACKYCPLDYDGGCSKRNGG